MSIFYLILIFPLNIFNLYASSQRLGNRDFDKETAHLTEMVQYYTQKHESAKTTMSSIATTKVTLSQHYQSFRYQLSFKVDDLVIPFMSNMRSIYTSNNSEFRDMLKKSWSTITSFYLENTRESSLISAMKPADTVALKEVHLLLYVSKGIISSHLINKDKEQLFIFSSDLIGIYSKVVANTPISII